ncbi:UDP-2,3-diacylglucosamine pyrophosphatase LpxH [Gemmobacter megaterium]|uniref:UDP-2,3-diacylglucosamine pyrophosphatase LpxH n=2 Tax=Gemmobacter megaterium TaxID=1086013 RepID=A0A1N7PIT8_9RHOB|nr:UDP-2,3-diacylglucosamine hydrolase [Gemmobacter megaterium]SIT10498.1 UDP-2,3-diacylglucosamine pyrophosphatase LpxH [Gemmobacter megaterium]
MQTGLPMHSLRTETATARLALRALFVSDLHLGALTSRADAFLDFLRRVEADQIFLVGDIFEMWSGAPTRWRRPQTSVLEELGARRAAGVQVMYLPGNHDDSPRAAEFAADWGFEHKPHHLHQTLSGARYLVLHGDQFDARVLRSATMTRVGVRLEGMLHGMDRSVGRWRRRRVRIAGRVVPRFHRLMLVGNRYQQRLAQAAQTHACHGVICGHFHLAALHRRHGIVYANCGDWIDSLTAMTEGTDGILRLMRWCPQTRDLTVVAQA